MSDETKQWCRDCNTRHSQHSACALGRDVQELEWQRLLDGLSKLHDERVSRSKVMDDNPVTSVRNASRERALSRYYADRAGEIERGDPIDPLHPAGRCRCQGDHTCDWCVWSDEREAQDMELLDALNEAKSQAKRIEELEGLLNGRMLLRRQPCGCVVCSCNDDERCHGCGGKMCGRPDCVFKEPGHPHAEYRAPNPYVESLQTQNAELEEWQRQMVAKAADKSLDGYREMGAKCVALEEEKDKLKAELATLRAAAELVGVTNKGETMTDETKDRLENCTSRVCTGRPI